MRSGLIGGLSVVAVSWLVFTPRLVAACEPAPNHSVDIAEDDSPECVTIEDAFSYEHGGLRVDNQCEEEFAFEVEDCPGCGDAISVAPGEMATMVIESREQASSATLSWSVGETSGQVRADIDWRDNSGACNGLGCHIGGSRHDNPPLWAASLLLLALVSRRSRH